RNLPYANRGYVFKDKKLQKYFSSLWWYMPDPQWQASTADFTPREWQMINEGK
ncbi:MAG: YARHG domain-containing protein, partial [Prevotella sp.]|nr:YARHG domain-containing protein [Prevotella sp.]